MRKTTTMTAAALAACAALGAAAQDAFDACDVFTQADARKVLGANVEPEPVNPRAKRPKVIPTCTWWSSKDGKPISASATFRFARTEADAQRAYGEEKLKFQTKPMLIGGATAFWSAKQGSLHLLKGRTWVTVAVGGEKPAERDPDAAHGQSQAFDVQAFLGAAGPSSRIASTNVQMCTVRPPPAVVRLVMSKNFP